MVFLVSSQMFYKNSEVCSNFSGFWCQAGRHFCILGLDFHICLIYACVKYLTYIMSGKKKQILAESIPRKLDCWSWRTMEWRSCPAQNVCCWFDQFALSNKIYRYLSIYSYSKFKSYPLWTHCGVDLRGDLVGRKKTFSGSDVDVIKPPSDSLRRTNRPIKHLYFYLSSREDNILHISLR